MPDRPQIASMSENNCAGRIICPRASRCPQNPQEAPLWPEPSNPTCVSHHHPWQGLIHGGPSSSWLPEPSHPKQRQEAVGAPLLFPYLGQTAPGGKQISLWGPGEQLPVGRGPSMHCSGRAGRLVQLRWASAIQPRMSGFYLPTTHNTPCKVPEGPPHHPCQSPGPACGSLAG